MTAPNERARHRANLFTLLSHGFSHPGDAFHERLVAGEYQTAVSQEHEKVFGKPFSLPSVRCSSADYEARYIDLFNVGRKGSPIVALHAGDYSELLDGQPRPAFMLEYNQWYRHFGLKVRQNDPTLDLPDHLVCQLQFLAWLSHLESESAVNSGAAMSYQCAQTDFIHRQLEGLAKCVEDGLASACSSHSADPFFAAIGVLAQEVIVRTAHEFASISGSPVDAGVATRESKLVNSAVDLWSSP